MALVSREPAGGDVDKSGRKLVSSWGSFAEARDTGRSGAGRRGGHRLARRQYRKYRHFADRRSVRSVSRLRSGTGRSDEWRAWDVADRGTLPAEYAQPPSRRWPMSRPQIRSCYAARLRALDRRRTRNSSTGIPVQSIMTEAGSGVCRERLKSGPKPTSPEFSV